MAEFIPTISLGDFKKLKAADIRRLKCMEIVADGEYVCTIIVPKTDYIRLHSEQLGVLSNAVAGEDLNSILKGEKCQA